MDNAYPWHRPYDIAYVGLNFEHIFNGLKADNPHAMFTPRKDPVNLFKLSFEIEKPPHITLYWPAEGSAWGMESQMVYTLRDDGIDMDFSATPKRDEYSLGYAAMMFDQEEAVCLAMWNFIKDKTAIMTPTVRHGIGNS